MFSKSVSVSKNDLFWASFLPHGDTSDFLRKLKVIPSHLQSYHIYSFVIVSQTSEQVPMQMYLDCAYWSPYHYESFCSFLNHLIFKMGYFQWQPTLFISCTCFCASVSVLNLILMSIHQFLFSQLAVSIDLALMGITLLAFLLFPSLFLLVVLFNNRKIPLSI